MEDLLSRIPEGALWTTVAVVVIAVYGQLQVLSEEGAKKLFILGRLFHWLSTRRERAIEREVRVEGTRQDSMKEDILSLRRDLKEHQEISSQREKAALEREKRLRKDFRDREHRMQDQLDTQLSWIEYATDWARQVILMAAEHGWHPPLPRWSSFHQWQQEEDPGPDDTE